MNTPLGTRHILLGEQRGDKSVSVHQRLFDMVGRSTVDEHEQYLQTQAAGVTMTRWK
jgi:hypothetical protein